MIQFDEVLNLATCRLQGVFEKGLADELLCFLQAMELAVPEAFNRLLDLEKIVEIQLSATDLQRIAEARWLASSQLPVCRSAIFAPTLLTYAIAKVYQNMMEGSNIQVGVFADVKAVAEWLKLPESALGLTNGNSSRTGLPPRETL